MKRRVLYFLAANERITYIFKFLQIIYFRHGANPLVKKLVCVLDSNNSRRTSKAKILTLRIFIKGKNGKLMAFVLNEHIDFVYFMNLSIDKTCFELMKTI